MVENIKQMWAVSPLLVALIALIISIIILAI